MGVFFSNKKSTKKVDNTGLMLYIVTIQSKNISHFNQIKVDKPQIVFYIVII